MAELRVEKVNEASLADACGVMREAATWLSDQGMPLWDLAVLEPEAMRGSMRAGEIFLARVDGAPAGTIILQETDPVFWPEITDGESLFFHKLAVSRKFAGRGVAKLLLDYAYAAAKVRRKKFLRMDCSSQHTKLRPFYESHGFQFIDQRPAELRYCKLVDRLLRPIK